MTPDLIDSRKLKFTVRVASGIRDSQQTSTWVHDKGIAGCAVLIGYADRQFLQHLPVKFDIPGGTARIPERS